ncbi:unnamed protein product [Rotaria sp. Silwood2]|nr:unnamed protein product [Rotaria sp. Silwood2]
MIFFSSDKISIYFLIWMAIDEEQQANAMDSPFKSTITKLVYDVLTVCGISIKQVHDKTSRVCFNSIVKAGDYETMVRNTEISWSSNESFVANKYNLVHAIVQCTGLKYSSLINDVPQCISIQDALKIIQNHPSLSDLKNILIANIKKIFWQKLSSFGFKKNVQLKDIENIVYNYQPISRTTTPPSINTTIVPSTIYSNITITSSQMRIVSQINVNGVQRLAITDGNRFFFSK